MGFVAGAPVAPVVGAVEILNGAVGMVDVVMQLMAAVGAVQQTSEHILLGVLGLPALCPLPELLHLFPCGLVDDGLMVVFKPCVDNRDAARKQKNKITYFKQKRNIETGKEIKKLVFSK